MGPKLFLNKGYQNLVFMYVTNIKPKKVSCLLKCMFTFMVILWDKIEYSHPIFQRYWIVAKFTSYTN